MTNKVFINNLICDAEEAKISIFDRGYLFSDGIYELIPYFNSKSFLFDGHYLRLEQSLKMIDLKNPYTKKEWVSRINEITSSCKYKNFSLYIQVTRGIPENFNDNNLREHAATKNYTPSVVMFCSEISDLSKKNLVGQKAIVIEDKRWLQCDIKSIALLFNSYAKTLAHKENAYEAILVRDGYVTEGCTSNVFIVKNNIIKTAPQSNLILPGVTRKFLIDEVAVRSNIDISIQNYTQDDLMNADEVFITNSTKGILPITKLNNNILNKGSYGPVTEILYKEFLQHIF